MRDFWSWGDIGTVYIYNFMKYTEECQELAGGGWSCSGFQIVLIHSLALVTSFYYTIFFLLTNIQLKLCSHKFLTKLFYF